MARPWTVLRHDPLRKLAENLWEVVGDLPGMPLTRRMTVVRLGSGELVIHSAIACDPATMRSIEALGTPAYIVVPSAFHRLDAHAYKARYPGARVVCRSVLVFMRRDGSVPISELSRITYGSGRQRDD